VTVRKEKGGTVLLSFQATELSGPTRFILQFGPDAEVMEPKALREHLVKVLKETMSKYR
jgi:predicted DNA-binding transcriptional regulator YafY